MWARGLGVAQKAGHHRKHGRTRLSEAAYEAQVHAALAATAAEQCTHGKTRRTQQGYEDMAAEFAKFRQQQPPGKSQLEQQSPGDILLFLRSHWVPSKSGREQQVITAGYLKSAVSQLSYIFRMHGYKGRWETSQGLWETSGALGNPVLSEIVDSYVDTFSKMAAKSGQRERSAVPMTEEKLQAMVEDMNAAMAEEGSGLQVGAHSKVRELTLRRDKALWVTLWSTGRRCADHCRTRWDRVYASVQGPAGKLATDAWQSGEDTPSLYFSPTQDKTTQSGRVATIQLHRTGTTLCPVNALRAWWEAASAAEGGLREGTLGFGRRRASTSKQPLSTSSVNGALRRRLDAAGLYEGETVHGFKRGRVQHELQHGASEAAVSKKVATSTLSIVRKYGDEGRHLA